MDFNRFVNSQLHAKPPYPTHDFTNQVIVVTGANIGLGFEAARHFVRLNAAKVILAVRSTSKGDAAKADIEASTGRKGVIDVYPLDLSSYSSVKHFASQTSKLPRIDAVVENAGIAVEDFEMLEDNESTITVNVISTILLAILLLPALRKSAKTFGIHPVISIVSSGVHARTNLPEWAAGNTFDTLNDEKKANMLDRYPASKLLSLFAARELAQRIRPDSDIVINSVNPGLCHSSLCRNIKGSRLDEIEKRKELYARTTDEGSRTLVHAVSIGSESNGKYLDDCQIRDEVVSEFVRSFDGEKAQKKIWKELEAKLEMIQPGIMDQI